MNFILFENVDGKESFLWENEVETLPNAAVSFTYYQQDNMDENGVFQSHEYIIGTPVKLVMGDTSMYYELDSNSSENQGSDTYCLYVADGKKRFKLIKPNTTLVNDFSELESAFTSAVKKGQAIRR